MPLQALTDEQVQACEATFSQEMSLSVDPMRMSKAEVDALFHAADESLSVMFDAFVASLDPDLASRLYDDQFVWIVELLANKHREVLLDERLNGLNGGGG